LAVRRRACLGVNVVIVWVAERAFDLERCAAAFHFGDRFAGVGDGEPAGAEPPVASDVITMRFVSRALGVGVIAGLSRYAV
jgi:hypothetical protein